MTRLLRRGDLITFPLFFLGVGVGAASWTVGLLLMVPTWNQPALAPDTLHALLVLLILPLPGVFFGGPAAIVTGLIAAALHRRLSPAAYVACCTVVGAVASSLWQAVILRPTAMVSGGFWLLPAFGAAAASLCAVLTRPQPTAVVQRR